MEIFNQPLVSVPIVTYNSSETILETLESIKAQTYPNLELIISDDCSKDNTVEVCQQWVEHNKDRFVRTQIITINKNTGVSANFNRADAACRGEWIKCIAGDDALLPTCIEEFVKYINQYPDTIYVFSRMEGFGCQQEVVDDIMNRYFDYSIFNLSAEKQYLHLVLNRNCIPAPTAFYNRIKTQSKAYANDERIPMIEDYPKWINITKSGVQLRFVDKTLVRYRVSENSLSTTSTPSLKTRKSNALIYKYYLFLPRFKYYKSPIKKLGEIRKYIHCSYNAIGGLWWGFLIILDYIIAKVLNLLGCKIKI